MSTVSSKKSKKFNKKNWLISQLRRITLRYPPAIRARNRTKEVYYIKSKHGKDLKRNKFTCELCKAKDLKSSQVVLDHIQPVIAVEGSFVDWNTYIERLFCEEEGFQILCLNCHDIKTRHEDEERLKNAPTLEEKEKILKKIKKKEGKK